MTRMSTVHVSIPFDQHVLLKTLAQERSQRKGKVVTPADIVAEWIPHHIGLPCDACEELRDISREATWFDGTDWLSSFQMNAILMHCSNPECTDHGKVEVFDADSLEKIGEHVKPDREVKIELS